MFILLLRVPRHCASVSREGSGALGAGLRELVQTHAAGRPAAGCSPWAIAGLHKWQGEFIVHFWAWATAGSYQRYVTADGVCLSK